MRVGVDIEETLVKDMADETLRGERAVTRAMAAGGQRVKSAWRGQVTGSGLGVRLANTIRNQTYPAGDVSMRAAALVWTKAPKIIDAFERGALIRSAGGFWLAIPTDAAGRGGGNRRITPGLWEQRTGRRLRFVFRRRGPSLLVADDARMTARGLAAPKRGRRRKDGILTGAATIPIFILVRQVKLAKRLDLDAATQAGIGAVPGLIVANWPDRR